MVLLELLVLLVEMEFLVVPRLVGQLQDLLELVVHVVVREQLELLLEMELHLFFLGMVGIRLQFVVVERCTRDGTMCAFWYLSAFLNHLTMFCEGLSSKVPYCVWKLTLCFSTVIEVAPEAAACPCWTMFATVSMVGKCGLRAVSEGFLFDFLFHQC